MFTVVFLPDGENDYKALTGKDKALVDAALAQLALNPDSPDYWTTGASPNGQYIVNKPWKVIYQVSHKDSTVYVVAIKKMPSLSWSP